VGLTAGGIAEGVDRIAMYLAENALLPERGTSTEFFRLLVDRYNEDD
jgi:hypothetical protein